MKIIDSQMREKEKKWYYAAFLFSVLLHVSTLHFFGGRYLEQLLVNKKIVVKNEKEVIKYRFVETRHQEDINKTSRKIEEISDNDARANSSRRGDKEGEMPKGVKKNNIKQLRKKASKREANKQFPSEEEMKSFEFENSLSHMKPAESLNLFKKTDIRVEKQSFSRSPDDSFINMPVISIGERTLSQFDDDSFRAARTEAGKYFSVVKKKIENEWYKYMTFNYKTNNVLGSEALIHFKIDKNGKIVEIEKKYISGDFLFQDYCETAILNSGSFSSIPDNMDIILKKGTLDLSIYFGYDVSLKRKKEVEEERKNKE